MNDFPVDVNNLTDQATRLEVAFDSRLVDVWLAVFNSQVDFGDNSQALGWFLRMAYLRGYEDALSEDQPGGLFEELGVKPPKRASTPSKRGSK
ncbi:MAG: hypothetical protein ABIS18_08080 [Actinomycetota bacterium]